MAEQRVEHTLQGEERVSKRISFWQRYARHRLALAGLSFFVLVALAAALAPLLSPYNPDKMQLADSGLHPSLHHPLGTDKLGRDELTRLLYGGRVSIVVGLLAVVVSTSIGTVLGTISGFRGSWIDTVIMRVTDVFLSFPLLLLVIVLMTILNPSAANVIVVIGVFTWMGTARIVRGQVLSVKNEQFVDAAIATGARTRRIIMRHILPNVIAPIVVVSTLGVASAMLTEAALSFLGLGIQPPTASWGNMLNAAQQIQVLAQQPWVWLGPGGAITLTVLSINFMGDGLRDALDPRHHRG
ncbi:MAG: oligopeptide ABC transporter permease [Nitrolancea sp.]